MKKFLLAAFLMTSLAQAQSQQGALLTNPQTGGPLSTGWWLKVYGGVDYSILGDMINGLKAYQTDYQAQGAPISNSTLSTGNLGFLDGTEVGFSLDQDHALSFEAQNVSTQTESYSFASEGTNYLQSITPSLQDFSLNFYRTLFGGVGPRPM